MRQIIGITGGIGTGKSVVSRIVRCNGFQVYDCDFEAKRLMNFAPEIKSSLIGILGKETYNHDGSLNRDYVSSRIFSSSELRTRVNSLVHEAVKNDFVKFSKSQDATVFIESAILFTSGLNEICSEIWLVKASDSEREKRITERDSISKQEISKRMESQMSELELLVNYKGKIFIIDNDKHTPILNKIITKLNKYA